MRYKSIHSRLHHVCTRIARQGKQASVCFALALTLGASLASCAGSPSPGAALSDLTTTGSTDTGSTQTGSTQTGSTLAATDATPQNLDCKRLTGRMQIRILQIRSHTQTSKTSLLSRGIRGVTTGIFGGSTQGLQTESQYQRDVAELNAQNESLASQGCKTFDLDKELQAQSFTQTPTPR